MDKSLESSVGGRDIESWFCQIMFFVLIIEGKLLKCTVMSESHYSKQTSKQLTTKIKQLILKQIINTYQYWRE